VASLRRNEWSALYGIGLPDAVLKKLYYQNALKLTPGLPTSGFPQ
jgi:hypothetical protein